MPMPPKSRELRSQSITSTIHRKLRNSRNNPRRANLLSRNSYVIIGDYSFTKTEVRQAVRGFRMNNPGEAIPSRNQLVALKILRP